jgi:hypothetical protein
MKVTQFLAVAALAGVTTQAFDLNENSFEIADFATSVSEMPQMLQMPEVPAIPMQDFIDFGIDYANTVIELMNGINEFLHSGQFLEMFLSAWNNYEVTTIHDARKWARENEVIKPIAPRSVLHKMNSHDAHHRIQGRRMANGRPPLPKLHELQRDHHRLGQSTVQETFEGLDNSITIIMGFVGGFVYTPGVVNVCADNIFDSLGAWINAVDDLKKIYMPWVWPEVQVTIQDIAGTAQATIYVCDVNKLFTTLTHLITTEGIAELGSRVAGVAAFELVEVITIWRDESYSKYKKAQVLGALVSGILNYTIQ